MSAADHLNAVQFMTADELRSTPAGDFPGATVGSMRKRWLADAAKEPQGRHRDHGGPEGYVSHLADSIRSEGLREPLEVSTWTNVIGRKKDYLTEGHHRALAALDSGLERIPYVHRGPQTSPWGER